jgi:hypothetical protein
MKFILMMQFPLGDWKTKSIEAWPPKDVKAHMEFLRKFNKELTEAGEFVRTEGLGGPEQMESRTSEEGWHPGNHGWPFRRVQGGARGLLDY